MPPLGSAVVGRGDQARLLQPRGILRIALNADRFHAGLGIDVDHPVFRIVGPAGPVGAALGAGQHHQAENTAIAGSTKAGGVKAGPIL